MPYISTNPRTKKALREQVAAGDNVTVFQPGGIFDLTVPANHRVTIEGPHYPQPHRWYAIVEVDDSNPPKVIRVVS
jgi:hypothetical protein